MKLKIAVVAVAAAIMPAGALAAPDWLAVDKGMGRSGAEQPGGVHRYAFPRSDLQVTLDGVVIKPSLALGGWVAFEPMGNDAMVMGDLVLTHEEVNPVMARLLAGGLTITALHNHLLRSAPATMYIHVGGHGDPVKLAKVISTALASSRTPPAAPPAPPSAAASNTLPDLDTTALDQLMQGRGKIADGVYQYGFPRAATPTSSGMPAPATMGTATAINFQPTGGGKAAITGDFVMTADEVDPVMRALRAGGIEITALHNHMLDDEPRLFFMHFWANQDARASARALRTALDKMHLQPS